MPVERRIWLALALAAVFITWLGNATDIDLALADAAYDARLGVFPWRHAWLTEVFSHVLLKRALTGLGLLFIAAVALDMVKRQPWRHLRRKQLRVVAASAVLVPAAVALLKQFSSSHCPWDIDRYGGAEPYVRLLESLPVDVLPGNCMPAGHASSAMWLMSLAVFHLPARPRAAAGVFALCLGAGLAVGWMQQLRGAHFLTHTLWTGWIACAIVLALISVAFRTSVRVRI
ncbi:MAG: phosphatase PAP2 family protein [Pseudomonadota bacterium]